MKLTASHGLPRATYLIIVFVPKRNNIGSFGLHLLCIPALQTHLDATIPPFPIGIGLGGQRTI
jgi:hypothetical protein